MIALYRTIGALFSRFFLGSGLFFPPRSLRGPCPLLSPFLFFFLQPSEDGVKRRKRVLTFLPSTLETVSLAFPIVNLASSSSLALKRRNQKQPDPEIFWARSLVSFFLRGTKSHPFFSFPVSLFPAVSVPLSFFRNR